MDITPVNARIIAGLSVATCTALGVLVGYKFAEKKFELIADKEIADFKEQYHNESRRVASLNEYAKKDIALTEQVFQSTTVAQVMDEAIEAGYVQGRTDLQSSEKDQLQARVSQRIFPEEPEAWDIKIEIQQREANGPGVPYIISQDEYMEGVEGYDQITLTYYEEDLVLADIKDEAVPEQEKLIGEGNLEFGRGSNDPNIVYIRNDVKTLDFEVIRSTGSYAEEVHGITPIKHSDDRRRTRRMRDE